MTATSATPTRRETTSAQTSRPRTRPRGTSGDGERRWWTAYADRQECGDREQCEAERPHDLALRLGRGEGEDDAAEGTAEEQGTEQVGPAEEAPGASATDGEQGEEEDAGHQPDGRREPRRRGAERDEGQAEGDARGQGVGRGQRQDARGGGRRCQHRGPPAGGEAPSRRR